MSTLFQDLSSIGILPSSLRCLQKVPTGGFVITFNNQKDRETFVAKSSFVVCPQRETVTVYVHDAPFELPDWALKYTARKPLFSGNFTKRLMRGKCRVHSSFSYF